MSKVKIKGTDVWFKCPCGVCDRVHLSTDGGSPSWTFNFSAIAHIATLVNR